MAKAAFVVTGIKEIDKKLRKLAPAVGKKVVRKSMRAGMKVVAAAAKADVPVDTGLTRANVKVRATKRSRKRFGIDVRIRGGDSGLKKPSTTGGKPTFYPAVIEYGRKGVAPNPFMRRAYSEKGKIARDITLNELKVGTEQEIKKL